MAHSNTYNPEGIDDLDLADPYDPSVEDESWDDMGGDTNAPLPKKKKGKLFTVVVIALGVVAFLGILYVQGGKTGAGSVADTAQIPAPVMVVQEEVGPSIAAGDLPALDVAVPDLTASVPLTPMPGLDEPPMPDAVMVAPDPIVTDLSVANTAEIEATIEPPAPVAMTVDDAQVSLENAESPVSEPAMNLGNDQPEEGATAEPAVPTPAPVEVPVPVSADIQKIDDLAKRLDALAQTVEGGGAAAPSAAVQNDMAALRRDLQDLMARLTALEQDRASQGVTTAPSVQPAPEPPAAAMPDTSVSVEPPVQKPVSHGDAAPALKRPNLILRSVVGGRAYVAASLTSPLQTVSVGDMVDGWGRVTDISKGRNGKWAVTTTGGTIRQK